jgi:signal transduction histidine kinase
MAGVAFVQGFFGAAVSVALVAAFEGAWLFMKRRGHQRTQALAAVLWSVSLWLIAMAFMGRPGQPEAMLFWTRCIHAATPMVPMSLLWLGASYLPSPKAFSEMRFPLALAVVASVWFSYGSGLVPFLHGPQDSGRLVLAAYFVAFAIASLVTMVVAARHDRHDDNHSMAAVLFGSVIIISSVFNLVFDGGVLFAGGEWVSWGLLTAGLVVLTVFAAGMKMLVDLRLIGAELIVLLVLGLFAADLVASSGNWFEFAFRAVVFSMLLVFAGLMTRGLVRNTQRLRQNDELHEQLIRMNGRLIEADKQKTKYVSFVSHQLQSPLAGIHIYLNMIKDGQFGAVSDELRQVVEANLDVLDRLIHTTQNFLNVTKIELGKVDLVRVPVAPADLVSRVVREMRPLAEKKGLKLETDVDPSLSAVTCDPTYVFHVLVNLVDNAVKYTPSGVVRVSFVAKDGWAEFRVKDTGMGLSDKDRATLFNIFERGESAIQMEARGEGLGLYIMRQFVDAHCGETFFESDGIGRGSTFGFRLPAEADKCALKPETLVV